MTNAEQIERTFWFGLARAWDQAASAAAALAAGDVRRRAAAALLRRAGAGAGAGRVRRARQNDQRIGPAGRPPRPARAHPRLAAALPRLHPHQRQPPGLSLSLSLFGNPIRFLVLVWHHSNAQVQGLEVRSCAYFPSNTLPLKLAFQSAEAEGTFGYFC